MGYPLPSNSDSIQFRTRIDTLARILFVWSSPALAGVRSCVLSVGVAHCRTRAEARDYVLAYGSGSWVSLFRNWAAWSAHIAVRILNARTTPTTSTATFGQSGQSQRYSVNISSLPEGPIVRSITEGMGPRRLFYIAPRQIVAWEYSSPLHDVRGSAL